MKSEYTVRAYRTETKYDTHDDLISLLDVQVPADALEFLRAAHNAQDSKDVTFTVRVAQRSDGDFRKLVFTSKGSKMKDFVPVATLQKWANAGDDLNSLFDAARFELALIVQVQEPGKGAGLFEEAEEQQPEAPQTVTVGVLNAPKEIQALPSSETEDAEFTPITEDADSPEAFLARCAMDDLSTLLQAVGYDPTDWDDPKSSDEKDMAEWRGIILKHWPDLVGTEVLAEVRHDVEGEGHAPAAD
ncbi:hypothetical protein ACFP9V_19300 [Deinococcus radiopugnans]|uniref:Uncharacterized protein n=1 Tax=Deinococcus radiopugnans ATCC 19172 TaxID=585398 RepID=A0A5C4Y8X7_9DEIO|nr:hypothetical protein [Deinococcus radiopugnans]MBB6016774.1 hypothetical protein [Deinococcus radiopugnans ATCC 19172]TNM71934.1 hypothetical protein FHR04_06090 [Deinococcus radiopugnans ATCC 19172]